jgi:hypothetical protein
MRLLREDSLFYSYRFYTNFVTALLEGVVVGSRPVWRNGLTRVSYAGFRRVHEFGAGRCRGGLDEEEDTQVAR